MANSTPIYVGMRYRITDGPWADIAGYNTGTIGRLHHIGGTHWVVTYLPDYRWDSDTKQYVANTGIQLGDGWNVDRQMDLGTYLESEAADSSGFFADITQSETLSLQNTIATTVSIINRRLRLYNQVLAYEARLAALQDSPTDAVSDTAAVAAPDPAEWLAARVALTALAEQAQELYEAVNDVVALDETTLVAQLRALKEDSATAYAAAVASASATLAQASQPPATDDLGSVIDSLRDQLQTAFPGEEF